MADLPPDVHPELRAIVEKYVARGYRVTSSTARTATLDRPLNNREALLGVILFFASVLSGSGGAGSADTRKTVELYMDAEGRVFRRGGWLSLLPSRFRRDR